MAIAISRLSRRSCVRQVLSRAFATTPRHNAASVFTMPAMSPTMTEGGITRWNVKEGQEFSSGDVLLEVETDKAQMDVEAQEDGVMAKILVDAGSKGVRVGTKIAVLAEQGDNIATLEIPADVPSSAPSPSPSSSPKTSEAPKPAQQAPSQQPTASKKNPQTLLPSVSHLLHLHSLNASQITGTGPKGRLLKGDVLAHIKAIPASSPSELQKRITKLGKLDLSNIKLRPTPAPQAAAEKAAPKKTGPPPPQDLEVTISMKEVRKVQDRLQQRLGSFPPVTVFIDKALVQANRAVPKPPGVDELFNELVGAPNRLVPANFAPKIVPVFPGEKKEQQDIFDILSGHTQTGFREKAARGSKEGGIMGNGDNVFRLTVEASDADRGMKFLEMVKGLLEKQPGMLVM
ncbi:hypothetical protein EX30DRAFT_346629 [Ascodesmis nigricans]|uniref:Uncharacterized protein n=1 Tax=Ascodesmis nigricans TaxID=341454 RepID=A0A4S2N427_9PEZI|nr:hypothetical protein EX30DRAFT_346629 [Ascodesmis nigricans]